MQPTIEVGATFLSLIFLAGLAIGIGLMFYITRDYFKKVKAAGKIPTWNDDR